MSVAAPYTSYAGLPTYGLLERVASTGAYLPNRPELVRWVQGETNKCTVDSMALSSRNQTSVSSPVPSFFSGRSMKPFEKITRNFSDRKSY